MLCTWGLMTLRDIWSLQLPHGPWETFVTLRDRVPFCSGLTFCQAEVKFAKSGLPYGTRIWSASLKCGFTCLQSKIFIKWTSPLTERMTPVCSCLRLQSGVTYWMHAIKSASISHKYNADRSLLACYGLVKQLCVCRATVHVPTYYLSKGNQQGPPCQVYNFTKWLSDGQRHRDIYMYIHTDMMENFPWVTALPNVLKSAAAPRSCEGQKRLGNNTIV